MGSGWEGKGVEGKDWMEATLRVCWVVLGRAKYSIPLE